MKHSTNTPYLIFITVVVPIALLFLTSSIWAGLIPSSNTASENYNVTITFNNNYLKIAEAYYNVSTNELRFTYYTKPTSATVPAEAKPTIYSVSTSNNLDVFCSNSIVEQKDSRHVVSCEDIAECSYIRIFFQSKYPDTTNVVEKVDEFGIITEVVEEQIYDTVYSMHIIAWSDITIIGDLQEITDPQVATSDPFNDYTPPSDAPELSIITEQTSTSTVTTASTSSPVTVIPSPTEQPTTSQSPITQTEKSVTSPSTDSPPPTVTASVTPPPITEPPATSVTAASEYPIEPDIPTVSVVAVAIKTSAADNNVIISVGSTSTVSADISPASATNKAVSWTSNRDDIATVSSSGVITAISAGIAIITCTTSDGGLTASCMVTVH